MKSAALVALGAYVGLVGAIAHRHTWWAGGVQWPWALALAIFVTYVVTAAAEGYTRVGGAWVGLGWAIVLMAQQFSPGESYLVASDWLGWSFAIGCLGAIVLGIERPPRLGK